MARSGCSRVHACITGSSHKQSRAHSCLCANTRSAGAAAPLAIHVQHSLDRPKPLNCAPTAEPFAYPAFKPSYLVSLNPCLPGVHRACCIKCAAQPNEARKLSCSPSERSSAPRAASCQLPACFASMVAVESAEFWTPRTDALAACTVVQESQHAGPSLQCHSMCTCVKVNTEPQQPAAADLATELQW